MIQHVVILTFVPDTSEEQIAGIVSALRGLPDVIDVLDDFTIGRDVGINEHAGDVAVLATFADRDDWQAYLDHPAHKAVVQKLVMPVLASRASLQFER